jgi:hypothetical protein
MLAGMAVVVGQERLLVLSGKATAEQTMRAQVLAGMLHLIAAEAAAAVVEPR